MESIEIEKAKDTIKKMDEFFLENRAKRFLKTQDMKNLSQIPEDVQSILYEGYDCFLYLKDSACVIMSSSALELALKMKLAEEGINCASFNDLIERARKLKIFNSEDAQCAHEIRAYRNVYVHGDIEKQKEYAKIIKVQIDNPTGLDLSDDDINQFTEWMQLKEIKPDHARLCLLHSYFLIRELYPLSDED